MSQDDDPWPGTTADELFERLTRHFDARHDEHTRLNRELVHRLDERARLDAELIHRLDEATKRLDDLELLVLEIQRGTSFTQEFARGKWRAQGDRPAMPPPPLPGPGAPRPKAIDDACAVPAGEPAQEVCLPRYGMVLVPEPGSDPEKVWSHVQSLGN